MNFIADQDIARLQIRQERREGPRLGDDRPRRCPEAHAKFTRDDLRQGRLAEARRAVQQRVIQCFSAIARGPDENG